MAWATVAAFILRKGGTPVDATSGAGGDGALVMGSNGLNNPNSVTALTLVQTASGFPHHELIEFNATTSGTGSADVVGVNSIGRGSAAGLVGMHNLAIPSGYPVGLNAGVFGVSGVATGRGVVGRHLSNGTGVVGQS